MEIGLVNNFLDSFYIFIDDQVEAPTEKEKCSQSSYNVAEVLLMKAVEWLEEWKNIDEYVLQGHQYVVSQLHQSMSRGMINQHKHELRGRL